MIYCKSLHLHSTITNHAKVNKWCFDVHISLQVLLNSERKKERRGYIGIYDGCTIYIYVRDKLNSDEVCALSFHTIASYIYMMP